MAAGGHRNTALWFKIVALALTLTVRPVHSQTSGCNERPSRSGRHVINIDDPQLGRIARSYKLYVPQRYNENEITPVVIDYHGYYDTGDIQEEESGIKLVADEHNFIAVWPNGLDDTIVPDQDAYSWNSVGTVESPGSLGDTCQWNKENEWNGYPCHLSCRKSRGCRNAEEANGCDCSTCADDIAFSMAILDALEASLCVDKSKIFLTGMSNGAMMVFELITHSKAVATRFAAAAPVAGSPLLGFGKQPPIPMPVMEIHGSADDIIPANVSGQAGPSGSTISSDGYYYEPVDRTMTRFSNANRCTGSPEQYHTAFDGITRLYCVSPSGQCIDAPTVRCSHSGGHTWPFGNGKTARRRFANLIWQFFTESTKNRDAKNPLNNVSRSVA